MPSITQLEYVVAVDRLKHFGKAAEACHVTQPTLSMQLQKLEEEIGFALFDRLKKPIVATPKGQRFITQARVLLQEHRKLMDLSAAESGELSGELRLGVIPTLAPYLLPLFLKPFAEAYPKVNLVIDELKTETIMSMLQEDQLDAGLLATPLRECGLRERPIFYEPFYLYVSQKHPLSQRKRIKESELDGKDIWLLADGHCFRDQVMRYCSLRGGDKDAVIPNVHFSGGNLDTLRGLIQRSGGYTLVPALFVESLAAPERKAYVRELESPVPVREVSLLYRRDQWKADIIAALHKSIFENLPEQLQHARRQAKQELVRIEK